MMTTIFFNKKSRLLIIGNSPWGRKVANVIGKNSHFSVSSEGARKFIQDNSCILNLRSTDIVWVCTTPELQISILKIIASVGVNSLIIIEKPILRIHGELNLYRALGRQLPNLQISNPWCHSLMWQGFKAHILRRSSHLQIKGIRQGPTERTYFRPDQDWLFHDVMLLVDLSRCLGFEIEFSQLKTSTIIRTSRATGFIGANIIFDIEGGYADKRLAEWDVDDDAGKVTLNFESNSAQYISWKSSPKEEFYEYQDNPIVTMVQTFLNSLNTRSHFESDINQLKVLG